MRKYLFALAGMIVAATPAAAQDFDGFRVEARAGYDWIGLNADLNDGVDEFEADSDEDGFVFGAEAGYDFPLGPGFVVGVYGGIDFTDP